MANPKLSSFSDLFGGAALNTALWNGSSGAPDVQLDTILDRVQIACQSYYPTLTANGPFDATGSSLFARVTPAPVGNGSTQTIMRFALDGSNRATFYTDGGQILTARVTNAGADTTIVIGPYDAYQHLWWRLRESSGNVLFDTSPDGYTWVNRATIAYTWNATAVSAVFLCGFYASESAGMAAYVDHVNTTSSAPGQPNLNWPLIEDAWAPYWGANAGDSPLDRYVEVSDRTRGSVSISRGRQYETDQVRSGEASLTLANTDAALDPTNASGPWAGHIQPYQPYRRRAQWPPTRNVLDQVMATGGDLGGYSLGAIPQSIAGPDIFSSTDSTGGSFVSSTTAWQGTTVMQFAVPSGTTAPTRIVHTPRWSVIPGQTYTVQIRVRNVTASTSLSVQAHIGWYTAGVSTGPTSFVYGSASALTGSTTAGWTTITVTGTAPANAAGMDVGAVVAATAAATCSIQADGWQLEKGSAATTWQCPGAWFAVYTGWTERWPSLWDMSGTYGKVQPTAVDSLSLLSQQTLSDSLTEEITSRSPAFLFTLGDPAGSTTFADTTGNFPAAPVAIGKYGAGTLTAGNAITATNTTTGIYTGATGTVVRVSNSNPGTNLIGPASYISLSNAGIKGPSNPSNFTRMIAFRYTGATPTSGNWSTIWVAMDKQRNGGFASGSQLSFNVSYTGNFYIELGGPSNNQTSYVPGVAVNDGNWHLVGVSYNDSTGIVWVTVDGVSWFWSGQSGHAPTGCISDTVGNWVDATVGNGTAWNFQGDISYALEFPTALGQTDFTNIYTAWKAACAGESTEARYVRILRYAGYQGINWVQTGLTRSMGPASFSGQDAMTALQAVVDTENGAHFIDRDGAIQFKARSDRYNALTPMYVFGENAGEYPYEDCQLDYDPTHLANQVTVTQDSTNQNFYASDATSLANYFTRTLTRTVNSSSAAECQDAANYLLSRYKNPAQRVSAVKLHPSANPVLWPVLLNLELGTRIRVMRRAPNVPTTQVDCFIEHLQWDFDDGGEAWCTLQCSPADLTPYAIFTSFHTTLASTIASGVTTITINAGADNTNPAAAQVGQGQQLVLGLGTANQETVTVLSVGTTTTGWTTATITLQAATTKSHTAADVVCEPLPTGVTSATKYDSSALFDSSAFAY